MYCREEIESKKSLYYMLNYDLRTRNPAKIYRYCDLIALINRLIENGELANFKGKVYRATKLDENLIVKLEPGSTMINTTFWSTSKDFGVAENFLKNDEWRNSFIYCKTIKNNVDIDFENLNYFAEKEVLFLPFTQFKVEKIIIERKYNRKIFTIELTELETKNYVNLENMQIVNINDINYMKFYNKKIEKEKGEEKEKEKEEKKEKENNDNIIIKKENEKELLKDNKKEKKEEKRDENLKVIKKFRFTFQLQKEQFSDDYLKNILTKANYDFEEAMMIHLDIENEKKEKNKESVRDINKLNLLVKEFRKFYQLSPEDYPDDIIKDSLIKKEGDFNNAFEELMKFIQ